MEGIKNEGTDKKWRTDDGYFLGQQGGTDQCRYCKNAGESNLDKWAGT